MCSVYVPCFVSVTHRHKYTHPGGACETPHKFTLIFAFADLIEIDVASDLKDFPHISLGLAGMFLGLLRVYIRTHT